MSPRHGARRDGLPRCPGSRCTQPQAEAGSSTGEASKSSSERHRPWTDTHPRCIALSASREPQDAAGCDAGEPDDEAHGRDVPGIDGRCLEVDSRLIAAARSVAVSGRFVLLRHGFQPVRSPDPQSDDADTSGDDGPGSLCAEARGLPRFITYGLRRESVTPCRLSFGVLGCDRDGFQRRHFDLLDLAVARNRHDRRPRRAVGGSCFDAMLSRIDGGRESPLRRTERRAIALNHETRHAARCRYVDLQSWDRRCECISSVPRHLGTFEVPDVLRSSSCFQKGAPRGRRSPEVLVAFGEMDQCAASGFESLAFLELRTGLLVPRLRHESLALVVQRLRRGGVDGLGGDDPGRGARESPRDA